MPLKRSDCGILASDCELARSVQFNNNTHNGTCIFGQHIKMHVTCIYQVTASQFTL